MTCGTGKDLGLLLFDLLKLNVYYIGSFTVRDTIILAGPLILVTFFGIKIQSGKNTSDSIVIDAERAV